MNNFVNPKDLLYPIGSVYISKYDELNNGFSYDPSLVFGGTWKEVFYYENIRTIVYEDTTLYYLDPTFEQKNFYNYNENTGLKEKVRYYVRIA